MASLCHLFPQSLFHRAATKSSSVSIFLLYEQQQKEEADKEMKGLYEGLKRY